MSTEAQPIIVDENRWMKMKPKAVAWIVGIVAVALSSWLAIKFDMSSMKRDIQGHTSQLTQIEADAKSAKETMVKLEQAVREAGLKADYRQDLVNQKLEQILAEKRGKGP